MELSSTLLYDPIIKKKLYTGIPLFNQSLLNCVLGVLACSRGLRVYVLACLRAWRAYVLGVFTCLRAFVLGVLGVLACVRACLL